MGESNGEVEEEWRRFKERILEAGEEVCATRKIREGKRSEWGSEGIRRVVGEKEGMFLYGGGQGVRKIWMSIGEWC